MKRENLYLVGGALLASTALSTAAQAGALSLVATPFTSGTVTTTARGLSAQIFAATPTSSTVIGPTALVVRFSQPISANFSLTIFATGAQFKVGGVSNSAAEINPVNFATFSGTGSIFTFGIGSVATAGTLVACSVQPGTTKILLSSCTISGTTGSIGGLVISTVNFDTATAMATAGSTIGLSYSLDIGSTTAFDTGSNNVLTSRNSVASSATANSSVGTINVNASPAFTAMSSSGLSAILGTLNLTVTNALTGDLSTTASGTNAIGSGGSITLKSAILSDDAVTSAAITTTVTATQFGSGFVTFALTGANFNGNEYSVKVDFNGSKEIDAASAGTIDITYGAAGGTGFTGNLTAPPAVTGLTGATSLSRSGLSIDINGVQPGVAQGARTYTSLLRVANTGTFAGTVTIVVKNENSGATLGTYTSASIPGGASLQLSSATIESGAGITGTASVTYRLTVSGPINGYVQHVNWNQDAGFFSDLSGRRT